MDVLRTVSRREAVRLVAGGALAIAGAGLVRAQPAAAGISWCRKDPVISLKTRDGRKGNSASIYLSAALEDYELNNSSGDIVIEHPTNAKTNLIWVDSSGYFGQGVSTNFKPNKSLRFGANEMEVRVRVYIPASRDNMRIRLEWAPGPIRFVSRQPLPAKVVASAEGFGNQWITLKSTLPYA